MNKKMSVQTLTEIALLTALTVVLNSPFASISTNILRIGFAFVPVILAAIMFGPLLAVLMYVLADLLGALIFWGGAVNPGVTLCCALTALVFGLFLHNKSGRTPTFFKNMLPAVLINQLIVDLLLKSLALALYYGNPFSAVVVTRIVQTAVYIPLQLIFIPILQKLAEKINKALKASA